MSSRALVLIPFFAALQPAAAAAQCVYDDLPHLLVPADGAQDVVDFPLLLVSTPIAAGNLELAEVQPDGGLFQLGFSTTGLPYLSGYQSRVTLRPTGLLLPDTTYRVTWVSASGPRFVAGQFFTGPSTSTPAPLPLAVEHRTFRTKATSGICLGCLPWDWGTDRLTWSADGGDTWVRIKSSAGEVLASGVSQGELAYFECTPAAQLTTVGDGFVLRPDAGAYAMTVDFDFFDQTGQLVTTTTATLDVTCQLEVPQGCGAPPDGGGGGGGGDEDAGPDGGTITPPREGCGCPTFGQPGVILLALAAAFTARARAGASRRRSGS
ncbi:MAG TPA: hypothetical protein VFA20_34520 [Myxococcaceae bacterium]|nr:hypothetical protein [Myxococcaceae bacterium]